MVAETELGSCNHVPHGAPIVKSEVDSISVISADRTPPFSVRAPACNGNASTRVQNQSPVSLNDDSPEFVAHYSGMHAPALFSSDGGCSDKLHVASYVVNNEQTPTWYGENSLNPEHTNAKRKLDDDFMRSKNDSWINTQDKQQSLPLYSEVEKNGKLYGRPESINPIEKPARLIESHDKHKEEILKNGKTHNDSKWGKASSVVNAIRRVLPGTEKIHTPNHNGSSEKSVQQSRLVKDKAVEQTHSNCCPVEMSSKDVIYMNREASETDLREESQKKRNSLQEILKSYFDKTLNSKSNSEEDLNNHCSEKNKLLGDEENEEKLKQSHDESHDVFDEVEKEPFLSLGRAKHGRTALFHFRSNSLEQAEKHDQDRAYDSDDSIGKTMSLRSQSSMRSRISRISNLSYASGPVIKIDPDESKRIIHTKNSHSLPMTPKRKRNIAYVAFSSFETETSEAPSSSVSCESLSPRSLPSETQSDTVSDQYKVKGQQDNQSDKSSRNVAIGSLKHKSHKYHPNADQYVDVDSGVGSLPKSINGSRKPFSRKNPGQHGNSLPQINVTRPSLKRKDEETFEKEVYDKLVNTINSNEMNVNGDRGHDDSNGYDEEEENISESLLTPLHFLDTKAKRGVLRKQQGSEIDEYDC
jgi:hypothetical protein